MTDSAFLLPNLSAEFNDAEIVLWHVSVGDHVVAGQPLLSVATDAAVVEIPAPRSGRIAALGGIPGDRLQVGDLLIEFAVTSEDRGAVVGELPDELAPDG
jgi:pyruvate dehydrogenase E2 component (dihydrolipoamide acetyltransferase)